MSFCIVTTIYRDGHEYDEFTTEYVEPAESIERMRRWLGNVIDNDPSLDNEPTGSES